MGNTGRKVCLSSFAFPLNLTQSIIQSRQKVLLYGLWLLVPLVYWGDTALPTVSWVTWAQFRGSAQQHTSGSNRGKKKKKSLLYELPWHKTAWYDNVTVTQQVLYKCMHFRDVHHSCGAAASYSSCPSSALAPSYSAGLLLMSKAEGLILWGACYCWHCSIFWYVCCFQAVCFS